MTDDDLQSAADAARADYEIERAVLAERERWEAKVQELIMRESGVGFADAATALEVLNELVLFGLRAQ